MKEDVIVQKIEEQMIDAFMDPRNNMPRVIMDGMIRHNLQVKRYVIHLSKKSKDTNALEIAALLHNVWRALPGKPTAKTISDEAHDKISAEEAVKMLRKVKSPAALTKKVKSLIENQEKGKTKESQILREADAIAFLENTLPIWFESGLWMGQSNDDLIQMAKKKVESEYKKIKSEDGKKTVKRFYDKWKGWIEQKELG